VIAALALAVVASSIDFVPARFATGELPALPVLAVAGAQVFLEAALDQDGRPISIRTLRSTPGFTAVVVDAVRGWRFHPAETVIAGHARHAVGTSVFVAFVAGPPSINVPTVGQPPVNVAMPIDDIAYPTAVVVPQHPPRARGSGVVMLEARVDAAGAVFEITRIRSAAGFDEAAADAVRRWQFRPARVLGVPASTFVYVIAGFPAPVA
jgi:TonB family protein